MTGKNEPFLFMQGSQYNINMRNLLFLAIILTSTKWVLALETIELQEVSSSKKSIIINRGRLDGVNIGSEGYFLKTTDIERMTKDFIGIAKAVKVYDRYSVWYFQKSYGPNYLIERTKIDYINSDNLSLSRAPFKIRIKKIIGGTKGSSNHDSGSDSRIVKKSDNFQLGEILEDVNIVDNQNDFDIFEFHKWASTNRNILKSKRSEKTSLTSLKIKSSQDIPELIEKLNKKESLEANSALLNKTSQDDFHIDTFYGNDGSMIPSQKERRDHQGKLTSGQRKKFLKKINKRGIEWSEDYSDSQLIEAVNTYGLYSEAERQKASVNNIIKSEIIFNYVSNFEATTSASASGEEVSSSPSNFGLSFEHMWAKNNPELSQFSTEGGFYIGNQNYDLFGIVNTTNLYGKIDTYWYLKHGPSVVYSPLFFIGVGLKFGAVSTRINNEDFSYALYSTIVSGGLKYRFGESWGLRGIASYVSDNLTQSTGSEDTQVTQSGTFNYISLNFGLSYYF